jgi:predicted DNA-binding ribbon-helix-helix protein
MAHLRGETVKSLVSKRSIVIAGHKTSVGLEDAFWNSLKEIASERGMTLGALVAEIDGNRDHANLYHQLFDFLCLASIAISVAKASGGHLRGFGGRPPL